MSYVPRILAFAGSARAESFNKKLIKIAVKGAEDAGGKVTLIDLADYPMPIMDEDLEAREGVPENGCKLKKLFMENDGLLLSCPEYNSSITPLLKNAIDWVSRKEEGEMPLQCYDGKVAALMSASPGGLGGLRGLVVVRMLLGNIRVTVLPDQVAISGANQAFGNDGNLTDAKKHEAVRGLGANLVETLKKLHGD